MPDVPPDAIPGLEGYLALLLSCIVLRRRRAAAHRAQVAPSIVKSRPWERGFTVEGRAPNKHRRARDVFMRNRMRDLSDTEFVRRYKVRKSTFNMMVARLRPELEPDDKFARLSSGSPVTTELQLSMTLRALAGTLGGARDTMSLPFSQSPPSITPAPRRSPLTRARALMNTGGCYLDIIDMHHVASATFYASFERTVKAINTVFADTIRFPWGDTPALERMSREFYAANRGSLDGCVLAVDGIAIKLQKPTSLDTMNPNQYYCRKGFHALNVQAGCDARLRFRIASIEHVGSTHDSLAWSCTAAAKYMEDDSKLPAPYYFVGDEAYVGSDKMLVPWPGRNLPRAPLNKDGYNYYQSRYVRAPPPPRAPPPTVFTDFSPTPFAGRAPPSSAPSVF